MACTRYGIVHAVDAQENSASELSDFKPVKVDPYGLWLEYLVQDVNAERR